MYITRKKCFLCSLCSGDNFQEYLAGNRVRGDLSSLKTKKKNNNNAQKYYKFMMYVRVKIRMPNFTCSPLPWLWGGEVNPNWTLDSSSITRSTFLIVFSNYSPMSNVHVRYRYIWKFKNRKEEEFQYPIESEDSKKKNIKGAGAGIFFFFASHVICRGEIKGGRVQWALTPPPFIQGDQLYMSVCFWYLVKSDCRVCACTACSIHCTSKSLFTRFENNTAIFIWS